MRFAVWVLVLLVVLMLVGVLPAGDSRPDAVFSSPVFIALLGLTAVSCLAACVVLLRRSLRKRAFGIKQAGFLFAHLSVTLILAGAFVRFVWGREGAFLLPIDQEHYVFTSYDGSLSLDFGVMASDLQITYYEPRHYDLFLPPTGNDDHVYGGKVPIPAEGPIVINATNRIERSELIDGEGRWVPFRHLPDGSILQISRTVRYYSALLQFKASDEELTNKEIAVNHPVSFRGWRFYLMDAKDGQPYLVLTGKRDPGWPLVRFGIGMMMLGVAVMCFSKTGAE